jgi:hypothetical protein
MKMRAEKSALTSYTNIVGQDLALDIYILHHIPQYHIFAVLIKLFDAIFWIILLNIPVVIEYIL